MVKSDEICSKSMDLGLAREIIAHRPRRGGGYFSRGNKC